MHYEKNNQRATVTPNPPGMENVNRQNNDIQKTGSRLLISLRIQFVRNPMSNSLFNAFFSRASVSTRLLNDLSIWPVTSAHIRILIPNSLTF